MSETENDLDNILGELSGKQTFAGAVRTMDDGHLVDAYRVVEAEILRRQPPDFANMPQGQFQAYVNALMPTGNQVKKQP